MTNVCLQEYVLYACKGARRRMNSGIMGLGNQAKFDIKCFIFPSKPTKSVCSGSKWQQNLWLYFNEGFCLFLQLKWKLKLWYLRRREARRRCRPTGKPAPWSTKSTGLPGIITLRSIPLPAIPTTTQRTWWKHLCATWRTWRMDSKCLKFLQVKLERPYNPDWNPYLVL